MFPRGACSPKHITLGISVPIRWVKGHYKTCSDICFPSCYSYFTCWCGDIEEKGYLALLGNIKRQEYPAGLTKSQKYILRRASKNYQVVGDQLHYIYLNVDGSTFKRLVLHGRKEVDQVFFMECHLTAGGHRGRDATIGKINARYLAKLLQGY